MQKRIRRHIISQSHSYTAVIQPALSDICLYECGAIGLPDAAIGEAGIDFTGKIDECYRANLHLRTASRILIRLASFRIGASEELHRKSRAVQWELWISRRVPVSIRTTVRRSRIRHEGITAETLYDALCRRFREAGMKAPGLASGPSEEGPAHSIQRIIIRVIENRCEISIDSTGLHLHNRGYRTEHTGAPLRETLAASLLLYADRHRRLHSYSWVADPMCGAGTVPIEAALCIEGSAPGLRRDFLFSQWPNFQGRRWNYLRTQAAAAKKNAPDDLPRIIGLDKDPRALRTAKKNAGRAGIKTAVEWMQRDFPAAGLPGHIHAGKKKPGLIIIDPPYGKRSGDPGHDFYNIITEWIYKNSKDWDCLLLCPPRLRGRLRKARGSGGGRKDLSEVLRINHGGLRISLLSSIG